MKKNLRIALIIIICLFIAATLKDIAIKSIVHRDSADYRRKD